MLSSCLDYTLQQKRQPGAPSQARAGRAEQACPSACPIPPPLAPPTERTHTWILRRRASSYVNPRHEESTEDPARDFAHVYARWN